MERTVYVTLDNITFEVEGTYFEGSDGDRETPPTSELFEIARVFCDLKVQQKDEKTACVDVTDILTSTGIFDKIDFEINKDLSQFRENNELY